MAVQRIGIDVAEARINENSAIGNDWPLRDTFVKGSGLSRLFESQNLNVPEGMQALISTNRARHMQPFIPFLTKVFESVNRKRTNAWKEMKAVVDTLGVGRFPSELLTLHEAVSTDLRFTNPDDLALDKAFATLLADEDLSREYVQQLDAHVTRKSDELLARIDEAAKEGKRIKIPYLIVGDGPNACAAATQLGAFNSVGIVSEQSRLAELWDRPLYINSSSIETNPDAAAFPLNLAGTTRVTPRAMQNTVRPKDMINSSVLTIKYSLFESNGLERPIEKKYISGPALRKVILHNEVCHADYFLMGQKVEADKTRISEDGKSLIITIRDVKTGIVREFDNADTLFMTGTGKEILKGVDDFTQLIYERGERRLNDLIDNVTRLKDEGRPIRPSLVTEGLPQLLTPTLIEKMYRLWDNVLERDDRYWPFRNLIKEGVRVGLTAGGDSGRTTAELIGQNGPRESYPTDLDADQTPDVVLYSVSERTKFQYRRAVRERYKYVYTDTTTSRPGKIRSVRERDGKLAVIDSQSGIGERFDYVILATGYERDPIVDKLAQAKIETKKLKDADGNVVGEGNLGVGIMIGGTALGYKKEDFPDDLRNIINILGVGENTVALWVYNVLLTRMLWTNGKVSKEKVQTLIQDINNGAESASQLRSKLTEAIRGDSPRPKPSRTYKQILKMATDVAQSAGLKVDERDLD